MHHHVPGGGGGCGGGETLSINVGRDEPTFSVTFSGYVSGTDAYFCGFLLGPVHMFASFLGPMPLTYICTLRVNN